MAAQGGDCTVAGVNDPGGLDADDSGGNGYCFAPPFGSLQVQIKIGGYFSTETDFDGVPYQTVWPGSTTNASHEAAYDPTSILFTTPRIAGTTAYDGSRSRLIYASWLHGRSWNGRRAIRAATAILSDV